MNTAFLLVLLTMGDAGQINAAFVNTDSLISCQMKSKMLGAVISSSGTEIIENRCFASDLKFPKFSHKQKEDALRYSYVISLAGDEIEVSQAKNKMECIVNKEKFELENKGDVYCTTSTQKIKRDEKND